MSVLLASQVDLGDQLGAVQPHVAASAQLLAEKFGLSTMSGYRTSNTRDAAGHPAGLAIDVPASRAVGDGLAEFAINNAAGLGVRYVIWQQRIRYPGKDWEQMAARTGAGDQNHLRHVHISFNQAAPDQSAFARVWSAVTGTVAGAVGTIGGAAGDVAASLNPLAGWQSGAVAVGVKIAGVLAGLSLLVLGMQRLVAPAVAGAVDKTMEVLT